MTTDELEQAIMALQDRAQHLRAPWQITAYKATRQALHRLVAQRAEIAKRDPRQREA